MPGQRERALQVHRYDSVEVCLGHGEKHLVADDAGIVHDDVEPAVLLHRPLDQGLGRLPVRDRAVVGDGLTAAADDLGGDRFGRRFLGLLAVQSRSEVVDHDRRAGRGKSEAVGAAEAPAAAGHDRDLAVEHSHEISLPSRLSVTETA